MYHYLILLFILWFIGFYGKKNNYNSYSGFVKHIRYKTTDKDEFKFKYNVKYDYFNLIKPPKSLLAKFNRKNYIGKNMPIDIYIKNFVKKNDKDYIEIDKIEFLGNIESYFYCFNPICLFYCFSNNKLEYIVAQVSNIPWKEKTCYLLKIKNNEIDENYIFHKKKMHVSPFNPSKGQTYEFKLDSNNIHNLTINVFNTNDLNKINKETLLMTVILRLNKKKFFYSRLPRNHITVLRIYIQALFLFLKRYRYFKHQ